MNESDTISAERSARTRGADRAGVTLDQFARAVSATAGVSLAELSPIDQLEIRTRNSRYHLTVIDPIEGRVLVQGGAFFPLPSEARLGGASLGGSMLKLGWIGQGFCLELHCAGQYIVTTPVAEIRHRTPRQPHGPF